jgi:ACS family tartrate transporter-like MFS transporter
VVVNEPDALEICSVLPSRPITEQTGHVGLIVWRLEECMADNTSEIERWTIRKVAWRLLPLIVVLHFVAYIDRTNVSFAAFGMTRDLGLTAYVYGWGAGIFFLGYFLFEVPSNLLLEKVGARRWIARIMISWGLMAAAMAFVQGATSFLVLRFLLGVAEAGFFPGVILYFTYWFPRQYRGRVFAALFLAVPGSNAVTAVISGALLGLDGTLGIPGWKWLYIVEAVPAVLLAFAVLRYLTERPEVADWLTTPTYRVPILRDEELLGPL